MKATHEESDTPLGDELRSIFNKLLDKRRDKKAYTYYGGKTRGYSIKKLLKARPPKSR